MRVCLALVAVGVAVGVAACGDNVVPDPCEGVAGACVPIPSGTSADEVDTLFNNAVDGQVFAFGQGTFEFTTDLSLTANSLTVVGQGMDLTILSFAEQTTGAQGLLVTGNDFTARDFAIEDTVGDGLKLEGVAGATGVLIERVRVEWTGEPSSDNGAYGLYPVQCGPVQIRESRVRGASDAGVYVGQSQNIIIDHNTAEGNVAGIEIENSTNADVHDNIATGNTGGILVFNLPGLPVGNGSGTRVFHNTVDANNLENFAPAGNIVGKVPAGTGIVVLAASEIEIFDNTISGHIAAPLSVVSYIPIDDSPGDPTYDPYPTAVYAHDNTITGVADMPTGELGALLILALAEYMQPPYIVPDQIWDGVVDPARSTGGVYPDDLKICFKNNGDADFVNLNFPVDPSELPLADTDAAVVDCTHPPLPPVTL
jgi:parallel beta-helix repeat protein